MKIGRLIGVRNDGDLDLIRIYLGHGEADAFDRNRSLRDDIAREVFRYFNRQPPVFTALDFFQVQEPAYSVHMALNNVSAKPRVGLGGKFEVDYGSLLEVP